MRRLLSISLLCLAATSAFANPSDKQPHAPLDLHGQQFAPELAITAQKLADKNRTAIEKFDALVKEQKLAQIDALEVGATVASVQQLRRAARQLILLGEPAGVDYDLRATQQASGVQRTILSLKATPQGAQGVATFRTKAEQIAANRAKQLPKLMKLVEQNKLEDAERELYEVQDELEVYLAFVPSEDRTRIWMPWRAVESTIVTGLETSRKAAGDALLAERFEQLKPDWTQLTKEIQAAAETVKTSGKYGVGGQSLTGPELIAHYDGAWQRAHVASIKALALQWARHADTRPTPEWAELRAEHDTFVNGAGLALASIIAADTARAQPAQVPELYAAYLPTVADVVDRSGGLLERDLRPALEELAAKNPEFAQSVAAYRAATDDVLRWRERVVDEQARYKGAEYRAAHLLAHAAFMRSLETAGLFEKEPASTATARLNDPAGNVLTFGAPKLMGEKATVQDVVALGGASGAGIARYRDRIYARVAMAGADASTEIAALEGLLQASEKQPPLSLAATRALRGAKRGDVLAAGGTITGIFLEGHVTRFATLPDAAGQLIALGPLPPDYKEADQLAQVVLRLDVKPTWLRSRYFLVEVK